MIVDKDNSILENKNYYRNILIKPKNKNKYYSVSFILYLYNNIYKLTSRFYKIRSFTSDIPLDYIYQTFLSILPPDLVNIIIEFYLKNDVSFNSIPHPDNSKNTIKFISNIKYSNKLNKYQITIDNPPLNNKENIRISDLSSSISNNFLDLLNDTQQSFDINSITSNKIDTPFDICDIHKITNNDIAWGINIV